MIILSDFMVDAIEGLRMRQFNLARTNSSRG